MSPELQAALEKFCDVNGARKRLALERSISPVEVDALLEAGYIERKPPRGRVRNYRDCPTTVPYLSRAGKEALWALGWVLKPANQQAAKWVRLSDFPTAKRELIWRVDFEQPWNLPKRAKELLEMRSVSPDAAMRLVWLQMWYAITQPVEWALPLLDNYF